jgi:hypothetical protein
MKMTMVIFRRLVTAFLALLLCVGGASAQTEQRIVITARMLGSGAIDRSAATRPIGVRPPKFKATLPARVYL